MSAKRLGSIGFVVALLAGTSSMALAQMGEAAGNAEAAAALNGGAHPPASGQQASVEKCWADWKAKENLQDGKNEKKNGYFVYVAHEQAPVDEPAGSRNWLVGRNAAFSYAE